MHQYIPLAPNARRRPICLDTQPSQRFHSRVKVGNLEFNVELTLPISEQSKSTSPECQHRKATGHVKQDAGTWQLTVECQGTLNVGHVQGQARQ